MLFLWRYNHGEVVGFYQVENVGSDGYKGLRTAACPWASVRPACSVKASRGKRAVALPVYRSIRLHDVPDFALDVEVLATDW